MPVCEIRFQGSGVIVCEIDEEHAQEDIQARVTARAKAKAKVKEERAQEDSRRMPRIMTKQLEDKRIKTNMFIKKEENLFA